MNKSLKGLKQSSINPNQLFDHMREFVNQNMSNPHVQNAIHQSQVDEKKGKFSSNQKTIVS